MIRTGGQLVIDCTWNKWVGIDTAATVLDDRNRSLNEWKNLVISADSLLVSSSHNGEPIEWIITRSTVFGVDNDEVCCFFISFSIASSRV
jgi:hypothetical protein